MRVALALTALIILVSSPVFAQVAQPTGCPRGDGVAVCLGAGGAPLDVALVSDGTTYVRLTRAGVITFANGATISGTTFPFVFGSQAAGDTMYASSATAWSRLAVGASAGMFFRSTGTLPAWSTLILPNAAVAGDTVVATATNTWGAVTAVAAGRLFRAAGTGTVPAWSTMTLADTFVAGDLVVATATNVVGSVADAAAGQVLTSGGVGVVPAYSATPVVTSVTGRLITSGTVTSVANVGADSCGTTAATIAGTDNAGIVTVGATAGTQCRVTFSAAAATRRLCIVNNETTANLARTTYVSVTTTDFLGTFVAGYVLAYVCLAR